VSHRARRPDVRPADSLDDRLRARLASAEVWHGRRAVRAVVDAAPAGTWTIELGRGPSRLVTGRARRAATTITLEAATLEAILDGAESGVDALMARRLAIRGNLALALQVGALLGGTRTAGAHPRTRWVTALGVPTFCLEAGAGPPVILLHGLGATSASMLPTLQALAVDHRVIAPDLPGFGDSGKPVRRLHAGFQAAWLLALMDGLGVERAHLVGNSMGGRIAIEVALRAPDRVDRIVLFAPAVAMLRPFRYFPLALARALLPELAFLPLPLPRRLLVRGLRAIFARPERLADGWYESAIDEFVRVFASPRGRIALFSAARQIYLDPPHGERGFWTRLRALSRPALFLWGDRDPLVPASFARHVADALPTATSIVLDDCGHIPQYEHPATTHALVREFLRTLPSPEAR
jgi:pimeloyl-ACP methyl ester carboxylesterase